MDLNNIILKPLITEKSMNDVSKGKFTFKVARTSDKKNIKEAIENKFKVNVISVATSVVKGKSRRFGSRRTEVFQSAWKKAIAQLAPGQKIDLFDAGGQKT